MGTLLSIAIGAALGFVVMLATGAATLARVLRDRKAQRAPGLERLARGASAWEPLASPDGAAVQRLWRGQAGKLLVSTEATAFGAWWDGRTWLRTTELPPSVAPHPTHPDRTWRLLPDGTWLTIRAGACAPVLEPSATTLPELPRCDPGQLPHRLQSATRWADGRVAVAVVHDDRTQHVWTLAPGAAAWTDAGALPIGAGSVTLFAGDDGALLVVGAGGAMARLDATGWTTLPRPRSSRVGWVAGLDHDGAVLAGGGFVDRERRDALARGAIVLAALAAGIALAYQLDLGLLALAFGGGLGVMAAVGAFFLVWIRIGARL